MLLERQFNKVLKRTNRKPRPNAKNMSFDINKNNDFQRKARTLKKAQSRKRYVRVLVTLDQNFPRTSRNRRRACMFLGLMMMTLKVNLMMKLLSMLQSSLVDVNIMSISMMRMSIMNNWLFLTKSYVSKVKRLIR